MPTRYEDQLLTHAVFCTKHDHIPDSYCYLCPLPRMCAVGRKWLHAGQSVPTSDDCLPPDMGYDGVGKSDVNWSNCWK